MADKEYTQVVLEDMMRRAGVKISAGRILILRVLARAQRPVAAQDIEHALQTVDRSSITRALTLFASHHLIHIVDDGTGAAKYELCARTTPHRDTDLHPHFHCSECGTTYCLAQTEIPTVHLPAGFRAMTANYVIKGLCADCSGKMEESGL